MVFDSLKCRYPPTERGRGAQHGVGACAHGGLGLQRAAAGSRGGGCGGGRHFWRLAGRRQRRRGGQPRGGGAAGGHGLRRRPGRGGAAGGNLRTREPTVHGRLHGRLWMRGALPGSVQISSGVSGFAAGSWLLTLEQLYGVMGRHAQARHETLADQVDKVSMSSFWGCRRAAAASSGRQTGCSAMQTIWTALLPACTQKPAAQQVPCPTGFTRLLLVAMTAMAILTHLTSRAGRSTFAHTQNTQ